MVPAVAKLRTEPEVEAEALTERAPLSIACHAIKKKHQWHRQLSALQLPAR